MNLSRRLQAVAGLVTPGSRLADVGTDHGYIPIELIKSDVIPMALAMDINKGPLERARQHIEEEGLSGCIAVRLSDGLEKLQPGEADSVVIAGMGGGLTIQILERGEAVLSSLQELILQPQSETGRVRRWLADHNFCIQAERMIREDGKFYPMMRVLHGPMLLTQETEVLYGPLLLREGNDCLREYLIWEERIKEQIWQQLEQVEGENAASRREEVRLALKWNREAQQEIRRNKA